jgi:hypothetical protein
MTTEEQKAQIAENQSERDEALRNLHDTLIEINAKVERVGGELSPTHLVQSHPVATSLLAGTLGFFIGSTIRNRGAGLIMIAAVLGFALSIRSSREASERDGRESSSTA